MTGKGFADVFKISCTVGSLPKSSGVVRAVASVRAVKVTFTSVSAPGANTLPLGKVNPMPIFPEAAKAGFKFRVAGSPSLDFAALSSSAFTKTSCSGSNSRLKLMVFSVPRALSVILTSSVCPRLKFLFSAVMVVCVCAFPAVSQTPDLNSNPVAQTHNKVNRVNGIR